MPPCFAFLVLLLTTGRLDSKHLSRTSGCIPAQADQPNPGHVLAADLSLQHLWFEAQMDDIAP